MELTSLFEWYRHSLSMSYSSHWHLISLLIQGMSKRWLRQRVNIS